jgi:hypothetical protein
VYIIIRGKSDIIAIHPFKSVPKYKFYYFSGENIKKHKDASIIPPIAICHYLRITSIDSPTKINSKVNGCQSI